MNGARGALRDGGQVKISVKTRSRKLGGTGLGLAIVKHIAQAHGGTVEVSSILGEGSIFKINLPV